MSKDKPNAFALGFLIVFRTVLLIDGSNGIESPLALGDYFMNASPKLCTVRIANDKLLVVSYEGNARRVLLNTQTRKAMTFGDRIKASGCIWKLQNIGLKPSDFTGLMTRDVFDKRIASLRNENGYASF